jgi:HSP20 family protein
MKMFEGNTGKIVAVAIVALVVIAVAVQSAMIFKMSDELDQYQHLVGQTQPQVDDKASPPEPVPSDPPAAVPPADPFDPHSDWFDRRVDPKHWDPFAEMQRMQEDMDRIFDNAFRQFRQSPRFGGLAREPAFSPRIDVTEEDDRFIVRLDLPGVDEGSVNVDVDGNKVRISGKRESVSGGPDKSGAMMRSERRVGEFARTIELPEPVDATKMEAKQEQGVFTIVLPKAPKTEAVL